MDNCPSSPCHLPALNQSNVLRVCWLCTVDPFYRFNHVSLWSFQRLPYVWWDWDKLSPECQVAGFSQGQTDWKTGMWYQKIQALAVLVYHQCLGVLTGKIFDSRRWSYFCFHLVVGPTVTGVVNRLINQKHFRKHLHCSKKDIVRST